jgi:hypothetical protein
MMPILVPLVVAVVGSAAPQWCEAPFGTRVRDRVGAPSLTGLPGLLEVPGAISVDRHVAFSFNSIRTSSTLGQTQQRNGFVSFGFLPRLTLVARGSVMDNDMNVGMRDISATAHLLVTREREWVPSFAVGAQDIGGAAPNFEARYAVASKTFAGRARLTAGFGSGLGETAYSLDGPFGGVEIAPCSWLTLIGENESRRRNFGVRLAPLGDWGVRKGIEPTIDVLWREGQGGMAGVGLRIQAGNAGFGDNSPSAAPSASTRPPARANPGGIEGLRDALVAHGFENVRVTSSADTLVVEYENRVFNREEWDALGVVMGEAVRFGSGFRAMRISALRLDIPVLRVASGTAAAGEFFAGAMTASSFAAQLVIDNVPETQRVAPANSSRLHLDLTVRPRLESLLLTEISVLETRVSALPEASLHLARGVSITGRKALEVHRSYQFPDSFYDANADQLLLHLTRPGYLLSGRGQGAISQVSFGRFGPREVGGSLETDVQLDGGRVALGGVVALFGRSFDALRRSVALGTVRVRHEPLGVTASLMAGRFLHGDVGGTAELERRFGLSEVAFFLQGTDEAKMAGFRVSLPLTTPRDLRPGPVRIRLPDYYDFSKRTQVGAPINAIRPHIARPLETGQDLRLAFRGRDRINKLWLMSQLERLRESALRWTGH